MALTTDDAARLARLREARDRLISGQAVAKVASQGRSKDFAQADMAELKAEIAGLEARAVQGRVRGALSFRYRS